MGTRLPGDQLAPDPALAAVRVVESAVDLARAEARLVLARSRAVVVATVSALLAVLMATSAAQVALLLVALSPILLMSGSPTAFGLAFAFSVVVTILGIYLAFRALRRLRNEAETAAERES
jgi:ABC-type nickel/cobalt efflux system permease component RcnA